MKKTLAAALIIGFLFAGAFTSISYPCAPTDGAAGCVSYEKALMHPTDLLHNNQNSLERFVGFFVINSFFSFIILQLLVEKIERHSKETNQQ